MRSTQPHSMRVGISSCCSSSSVRITVGISSRNAWSHHMGSSSLPPCARGRAPSLLHARYGGDNRTGHCAIPASASTSTYASPGSPLSCSGRDSCRMICMGRQMLPHMGAPIRRYAPSSASSSSLASSAGGEFSGTPDVPPSPASTPPPQPRLILRGAGSTRSPAAATLAINDPSATAAGSALSTSESDEFFGHQSGGGVGSEFQPGDDSGDATAPGALPPGWSQLDHGGDLQTLIQAIPFRRVAIWLSVGLIALQLKYFFGLIMGVFIISFIGNSLVDTAAGASGPLRLLPPPARRRALALFYFGGILAFLALLGVVTVPGIAAEGADFVKRLQSDNIWVVLVEKMRTGLGDQVMDSLEKAIYLASTNDITAVAASDPGTWTPERIAALGLAISNTLKAYTTTAAKITAGLLSSVTKLAVQAVVALALGFMLVWDMPSIKQGISTLGSSRLAPVYNEVAPVFAIFGQLFGKALEVQARIALINTVLTAIGMWLLEIPGIAILSLFVFTCSFIPIAGCIISTVPIGFVALTEYGFFKLALAIGMVVAVHFIEAYFLNPAIYSAHLKLHPLLVLSVLVFTEHTIGVWGLLLAVPMTVFMLDYCVRFPKSTIQEVGKKELEVVMLASMGEEEAGLDPEAEAVVAEIRRRQQQQQQGQQGQQGQATA